MTTSHSHLYAAWMRRLPWYQFRPDILQLLTHCLLKMSNRMAEITFIHTFPSLLQVSMPEPQETWERGLGIHSLLHHSFNFIHIWAVLNFTVSQQHRSCKHKPGAGFDSRVSMTERSYLSPAAIMSFSPCFKKRKDSCSLCHPTISAVSGEDPSLRA